MAGVAIHHRAIHVVLVECNMQKYTLATTFIVLEMSVNVNVQALSTALAGALSLLYCYRQQMRANSLSLLQLQDSLAARRVAVPRVEGTGQ